jgi:hypothetical protein
VLKIKTTWEESNNCRSTWRRYFTLLFSFGSFQKKIQCVSWSVLSLLTAVSFASNEGEKHCEARVFTRCP